MSDRAPRGYRSNPGHCPPDARGKRVNVILASGVFAAGSWPADGQGGCRWTLTGDPYDIRFWKLAGD